MTGHLSPTEMDKDGGHYTPIRRACQVWCGYPTCAIGQAVICYAHGKTLDLDAPPVRAVQRKGRCLGTWVCACAGFCCCGRGDTRDPQDDLDGGQSGDVQRVVVWDGGRLCLDLGVDPGRCPRGPRYSHRVASHTGTGPHQRVGGDSLLHRDRSGEPGAGLVLWATAHSVRRAARGAVPWRAAEPPGVDGSRGDRPGHIVGRLSGWGRAKPGLCACPDPESADGGGYDHGQVCRAARASPCPGRVSRRTHLARGLELCGGDRAVAVGLGPHVGRDGDRRTGWDT